jgi:ubiquinone/menaquinone biosynthesis C-methylase UbiE/DNA-binding transcriptional ArsR family regulator
MFICRCRGDPVLRFPDAVSALESIAETTRLRLVALMAEAELTVSELTAILGQSQPRISRHLKLLADSGILDRSREGAWAFFRLAEGPPALLARNLLQSIAADDPVLAGDRARLTEVRASRAQQAEAYFARIAPEWDRVRSLHVSDHGVEAAVSEIIGDRRINALLDIGTGTGRMLELFAPRAARALGVDQSAAMLAVARASLDRHGMRHVQLRQGDIYALPVERDAYDVVLIHQVLHFLDDPARALRETARVLAPGGRVIAIDFAPHDKEFLRTEHAHRRLGFAKDEIAGLFAEIGLEGVEHRLIAPGQGAPDLLSVSIWVGRDRRSRGDGVVPAGWREVA